MRAHLLVPQPKLNASIYQRSVSGITQLTIPLIILLKQQQEWGERKRADWPATLMEIDSSHSCGCYCTFSTLTSWVGQWCHMYAFRTIHSWYQLLVRPPHWHWSLENGTVSNNSSRAPCSCRMTTRDFKCHHNQTAVFCFLAVTCVRRMEFLSTGSQI